MATSYLKKAYKYKRLNNGNTKIAFVLASTNNKPSFIASNIEIEVISKTNGLKPTNAIWLLTNNERIIFAPKGGKRDTYTASSNTKQFRTTPNYDIKFNIDCNELLLMERLPTDAKC